MDGIDALRAIKNGKTVRYDDTEFRHGNFGLEERIRSRDWRESDKTTTFFIRLDGFEVVEPVFDLTFVEAFKAMLEGKRVSSERFPHFVQYIEDGKLYYDVLHDEGHRTSGLIELSEQETMWRVVE